MDCAAVKPKMEGLVSGTLPEPERLLAEQHISMCEGCRLELELVRAVGSHESPADVPQTDWTIDRIFGAQPQDGASAASPARRAQGEAEPAAAHPPLEPPPGPAPSDFGLPESGNEPSPATEPESQGRSTGNAGEPAGVDASAAAPDVPDGFAPADTGMGERDDDRVAANWDFEPADAAAEMKPPENSLFFAEEALNRRKEGARKKRSPVKVLLWGAGGVLGAALLAVTSWMVLHIGPGESGTDSPNTVPSAADSAAKPPAAGEPPATVEPPGTEHPDAPAPMATDPEVPELAAPPTVAPAAPSTISPPAPPAPPRDTKISASSSAQPSPIPERTRETAKVQPRSATTAPKQLAGGATVRAPSSGAPKEAASRATAPTKKPAPAASPAPGARSGGSAAPSDDSDFQPHDDVIEPAPAPARARTAAPSPQRGTEPPNPAAEPAGPAAVPSAGAPVAPVPSVDAPSASEAPATSRTAPGNGTPAAPPALTTVERLHVATVAAIEKSDLTALRRLRSSWKESIGKMGVGPDRSRAKRELADCLWGIQTLTGKRSDQKAALAAYREYLLSAPAGGADSRTVSRLRQLEDALSERP